MHIITFSLSEYFILVQNFCPKIQNLRLETYRTHITRWKFVHKKTATFCHQLLTHDATAKTFNLIPHPTDYIHTTLTPHGWQVYRSVPWLPKAFIPLITKKQTNFPSCTNSSFLPLSSPSVNHSFPTPKM